MAKTANDLIIEKISQQTFCIDVPDPRDFPYDEWVEFKEIAQ
jgi:hypothetical protein